MSKSIKCGCGKDTHPLYGGRCEDCWAMGNRCVIAEPTAVPYRGVGGIGSDEDSRMISNQGPQGDRWDRQRH